MNSEMWRRFERPVLWAALVIALGWTLWPVGEWLVGWSNQRALVAQWHAAQVDHKKHSQVSRSHKPKKKATTGGHFGSSQIKLASAKAGGANPKEEWPPTRITSSKIGLDAVVVQGVSHDALKSGPGHEPNSALPGEGNCVIAAHRNAYGWWFRRLDQLNPGDMVVLDTPEQRFIYRVKVRQVLNDDDTGVLGPLPETAAPRLTLYSCTLPKSDRRIVVTASLESSSDEVL